MAQIKKYTKKDGSKAYMFNLYLGTDPVTGKQRRTTRRGFRTIAEAKTALSRLELDVMENGLPTSKQKIMTFKEIYELWFEQYKTTVKESSEYTQNTMIKCYILPVFGNLRLDKIDTVFCQKQVNNWANRIKKYHNLVGLTRRIFEYAKTMKQIKINPMNEVIVPKRKNTLDDIDKQPNFYNKQQLQEFLQLLEKNGPYQMYVAFRVLAFTGLRKGELSALKWSDIDFENNLLSVNRTIAKNSKGDFYFQTPKTKKSLRTIAVDEKTMSILKQWKNELRKELFKQGKNIDKGDGLIFHNSKGGFIQNSLYGFLKKFTADHNLQPIKPHGFRHTHASLLFESGASIKEVQDRLGHKNIKTTMDIYTHVTETVREKTVEKFANYIGF